MIFVKGDLLKRVDDLGRITLPSKWRKKYLKNTRTVKIKMDGSKLIVEPVEEPDLTAYFDSIEVDVDPSAFEDYKKLKRALLGESDEVH